MRSGAIQLELTGAQLLPRRVETTVFTYTTRVDRSYGNQYSDQYEVKGTNLSCCLDGQKEVLVGKGRV